MKFVDALVSQKTTKIMQKRWQGSYNHQVVSKLTSNDCRIFPNWAQIPNGCTQEAPKGASIVDFWWKWAPRVDFKWPSDIPKLSPDTKGFPNRCPGGSKRCSKGRFLMKIGSQNWFQMIVRYSKIKPSKYQMAAQQVHRTLQKVLKRLISNENELPESLPNHPNTIDLQIFPN